MNESVLQLLEPVLAAATAKHRGLDAARKQLLAAKTAIRKDNALNLADSVATLKKVDAASLGIAGWADLVIQLDSTARDAMRDAVFNFTRSLRSAFEDAKVELAGGPGRFSSKGFVIEVDERSAMVSILYGKEPVIPKPLPLDAAKVFKAHAEAVKSLTQGRLKESEFKAKLFEAYGRVVRQEKREIGDRVNIVAVFREFVFVRQSPAFRQNPVKANFAEYPKWRFAFDLVEVPRAGGHGGYRMQIAPPTIHESDRSRMLWLPSSPDDGTFIADMWWRSDRDGS